MIYADVCSGISAPTVAWRHLGWRPAFYSEVDAFPRAVLKHHYPGVPIHGDFTTITAKTYEPVDVLVGGTPCQDFSVAGIRRGLDGARGILSLEFCDLAARLRPRWVVWENVPGVLSLHHGRVFGAILGRLGECGYEFCWRIFDAQFAGVPQRRRRLFLVGHLGDWRPAAAVLLEPESLRGDPAPRRAPGESVARPITPGSPNGSGFRADVDTVDNLIAFGGNDTRGPVEVATAVRAKGGTGHGDFESETFLLADPVSANEARTYTHEGKNNFRLRNVVGGQEVRRLTPRECERLQGFPDDYTLVPYRGARAKDGPRYKALGNSMAVPVVRWIGERIDRVEAILSVKRR